MRIKLPDTPKQNLLLAALPAEDYLRLEGQFEKVKLSVGEVIHEAGAALDYLYFPVSGKVSLKSIMPDGASLELAVVGNDGVVGVSAVLGEAGAAYRAVVQAEGDAYRISIDQVRPELDQGGPLLRLALRYAQSLLIHIGQNAVALATTAKSFSPCVANEQGVPCQRLPPDKLRQAAENRQQSNPNAAVSPQTDAPRLVHELQVQQIELELQNEALARAYAEADAASARYAEFFDFSPVAFITVDALGAISQVNLAGAILLGIKRPESKQYRFAAWVAPESLDRFNQFLERVMRERTRQGCELTLSATAQRPAAIVKINAVPEENGTECRMVVVDVTQKTLDARRWREREQYQRALLNTLPFMVWLKDRQGNFLSVNESFAKIFGWPSADSLVGKSDLDIASLELAESYRADDQIILDSVEPRIIEEWIETGDELRWFETFKAPVEMDGEIIGTVGYARDLTEYKIMVAALRNSEEEFRSLFEFSMVGTAESDPITGRILRVNQKFCEITGYPAEELLTMSFDDLTHPDDREAHRLNFYAVMVGEIELYVEDNRCVRKDGSIVWVNAQLTAVLDDKKQAIRTIGVIQDITIQKQAEAALLDQLKMQDMLAKIAATVPGVICSFRLRPDGTMCMPYATAALYEFYGLQPEDVREDAMRLLARIHADDINSVYASIKESAATMTPWCAEYRVHHPGKGILWVEGHSMPQKDPDGSILWHGYLMDITARKRSEEALRESERIYRAIGESIDYGIWICDADGRNTYASDSFLKLVGISQEECSNFGWGELLHPDDAEQTIAAWKRCAQAGDAWDREHRFRGVDGLWHAVLARGVPVRNELGEITHWAGINLDISRIKRVENALRERERDLQLAQTVAQTGSWRLDLNRDDLRWSDENYRIFGVVKGTPMSYEKFLSIVHPDDRTFVDKAWRNALAGAPYNIEHRIVVGGETRWVNERAELEFDQQGNLLSGFGCTQDITDRKRSEAALFASESRFRLAMEAIAGVVYDWDKRSDATYWSSGMRRIFGVSGLDAESGRKWWRQNVHPDDLLRMRPEIVRVFRARSDSVQLEYRMRHHAGYWIFVSDSAHIVRDPFGKVVRIIGSLTDISARKYAEEELRRFNESLEELVVQRTTEVEARSRALAESERFARATIDALSSSVCVLDGSGHIIAVNKAWREFARDNGALVEQVCEGADYLAICDAAACAAVPFASHVAAAIREFMTGRRQDFAIEYECHSPEKRRWFAMKLSCFPGAEPLRLVVRHEEITERKLAAQEQLESARRLQRLAAHLDTVREEQSATIAREVHDELGGTLTMAKLSLAILANDAAPATPLHNSLQGLLDQLDAALTTVKRISTNLRPALLDTLGLVATIKWHAAQFSEMTGIATVLQLPEYVSLSKNRSMAIFRIIQEALTNIAKHAEASTASIAIKKKERELIVEVSDNGTGITKYNRFKPDSFGLIGMQERAQYLGGKLSIAGTPDVGTRLTLRIPLDNSNR